MVGRTTKSLSERRGLPPYEQPTQKPRLRKPNHIVLAPTCMTNNQDHSKRIARAKRSLEGLSVGDAFGERFFLHPNVVDSLIEDRAMPRAPWACTDDTVMALSVVEVLEEHGEIHQDKLATYFASRYSADPQRGYGRTAHHILRGIAAGDDWRDVARAAFDGMGSMGNGGAMRAAPIGAYFENDE